MERVYRLRLGGQDHYSLIEMGAKVVVFIGWGILSGLLVAMSGIFRVLRAATLEGVSALNEQMDAFVESSFQRRLPEAESWREDDIWREEDIEVN